MPIFFQHPISETTRLGIWKIEEIEEFFKSNVPQHRNVTHPHKRLQHLAGRFLLQYLFPAFPYELIKIADTRKPFLPDEQYHFSISHCSDYAAAIVSKDRRVGIDIEIPTYKVEKIKHKFISEKDQIISQNFRQTTLLWCCKESVFKWQGEGGVDFKEHIHLEKQNEGSETIECAFIKSHTRLIIHYRQFDHLLLAWVIS